jgi:1-deoxy-D-xylulose-5-phosphate synthase
LAFELREEIIDVCSETGGHLASSLGAVELTVALHHVYDTARDRIVWDVGHQTYGHKILTGRRDRMRTIRRHGGLAGFTTSSESEHDALTVGHASTSLAAAFGMALARDARQAPYDVTAVIGDGALTGGMALAALNQIGHVKPRMTIVLNDNEMSISENVGALNTFMRQLQVQPWFQRAERSGKEALSDLWSAAGGDRQPRQDRRRRFFDPASNNPFMAMGLRYVGPIDGHDVEQLVYYLRHIRELDGPTMLHIVTRKGKGYEVAEADPITWHGASTFDRLEPAAAGKGYQWSDAFGDAACALAAADDRIWVITPAMREGSGLVRYSRSTRSATSTSASRRTWPSPTAAGLALRGEKPIVAIYSSFLQRGYDQVIHDVSLENLDVVFAIDRAGLVGGDGMTHQGVYDVAYLRAIPNLSVAMPRDVPQLRGMLKAALRSRRPGRAALAARRRHARAGRAGRGLGRGRVGHVGAPQGRRRGGAARLRADRRHGAGVAGDDPRVGVVDARFVKPLDVEMLLAIADAGSTLVTIEDHVLPAASARRCSRRSRTTAAGRARRPARDPRRPRRPRRPGAAAGGARLRPPRRCASASRRCSASAATGVVDMPRPRRYSDGRSRERPGRDSWVINAEP